MQASTNLRYPLAFTTLACPDWSWEQIVQKAVEYGYQGLELRGVEGEMDLTRSAPFTASRLAATKRELQERNLSIVCLDTSVRFERAEEISRNIAEGKRHIDLAEELGAPYIRVFGDHIENEQVREQIIQQVADGLLALAQHAHNTHVQVLLESHGDFARIANLLPVLQAANDPQVGVLWDVHHPYRFFAEPLAETYQKLKNRIKHVHLKDSVRSATEVRYCPLGEGDVPLGEVLQLLASGGYQGWLSFEWEKRWHPEIEEPEIALPGFVRVLQTLQGQLTN
ncbi:sugar phosphate isomerase/epimerase [Ktedonosporobacter rubrisoli]|uniref:Sugar phosphate isomerase/epimerase n=1 Tax=Ktedonosporobacter rubrisoli TaxID=2509675 RepID=A0A4P6K3M4_KTERU|nr:sugar phosphate isomerase/epimerase family protein [Ktedonosporobacter rubrisoli]QBD82513.1 sugar phosphate isomerase/epimerase [Ktedonosporobacter rubrisoli]